MFDMQHIILLTVFIPDQTLLEKYMIVTKY